MLSGVTEALSRVTINKESEQHITMASKGINPDDNENNMLLAIACLESRLLEIIKKT